MIDPIVCGALVSLALIVGYLSGAVVHSLRERDGETEGGF
jgi:hypothetical protein